jgi:hypothetical protein
MNDKKENIDRYFSERLEGFEQIPPEASWDRIAQKLGHNRKKSFAFLFFRIAAGMALLVSTGIGYYLLTKPAGQPKLGISARNVHTIVSDTIENEIILPKSSVTSAKINAGKESQVTYKSEPTRKEFSNDPAVPDMIVYSPLQQHNVKETVAALPKISSENQALTSLSALSSHQLLYVNFPTGLTPYRLKPSGEINTPESSTLLLTETIEDYPEEKTSDRWALGSEVAPMYSYRTISSDNLQSDMIDNLNESEKGLLAYSGGIRVAFSTGKRLSVQSGVYYSRYGQEKNQVKTIATSYAQDPAGNTISQKYISVTNSTGVITNSISENAGYYFVQSGNRPVENNLSLMNGITGNDKYYPTAAVSEESDITLTQYFDYFEVPLVLKYKLFDRKIDFNLSGGLITNFLVGNKVNIMQDGEFKEFGETTNINRINYQGSFGVGIEYPVISGFSFTIEPRFRYYINQIDQSSQINVHPFSFGFFAGFNYSF